MFQTEGGGATPTSPLQLHLGTISLDLAIDLNRLWHSRLPVVDRSNIIRNKYSISFGAEFGGRWYASAIWSSPVARLLDGTKVLELRRFAIAPDAPKNTASRMLRVMCNKIRKSFPAIKLAVSYQDEAVHAGTIYKAAGWMPTARNKMAHGPDRTESEMMRKPQQLRLVGNFICRNRSPE